MPEKRSKSPRPTNTRRESSRLNKTIQSHYRTSEMLKTSINGTFMNTLNEHQTNELQQTTTNAHISTDSHEHILEPQVTAITETTNIETETTARLNITCAGFQYDTTTDYASNDKVTIGRMTDVCQHCNAQKWKKEPPTLCCSNGKAKLPLIEESPLTLKRLLEESTAISKHFRSNINKYFSAFQMTSFGTEHNLTSHALWTGEDGYPLYRRRECRRMQEK